MSRRALAAAAGLALLVAACDKSNTVATGTATRTRLPTAPPVAAAPLPVAATPAGAVTAAPAHDGIAALTGLWRVTAVRLSPGDVQALVPNDPSDMGAVLDIAGTRLAWQPRTTGSFDDVCNGPHLADDGTIACRDGSLGPPGAHLVRHGAGLTLDWYDGAILELVKQS